MPSLYYKSSIWMIIHLWHIWLVVLLLLMQLEFDNFS
jgi:hypothetical protein